MPGVPVNVSLLLRDGVLEHLSIPAPATAPAASAAADSKGSSGGSSGALSPTTAAAAAVGRISWVRLLQELVTATHAFSVDDDAPVMIDAAGTSPTGKSLVPPAAGAAADAASARGVADCFHIAFTDDESDLVTLTSDSGLTEAYRVIEKSRKPTLELSVTVLHPPPALSAFTAAGGNATAGALDFKTIRTPQLAAAVAAAAAATPYGAPGGAPIPAAAAGQNGAAPALQRPGSGPIAGAAPNGGSVPHALLPPGALPDSKLNPILGVITATVGGGRPSGVDAAQAAAGNAAAAAALQLLSGDDTSPFKEVVMKHTRRALQAFESFFLNLKKDHYVARTRRNQTFARVDEARTPAPQYAALKAKHQAELTAMDARLQRNIDTLVTEFDRYLSNQSPASFLLPLLVSVSVENRGMRYEVPVRPCDTVADLRDALMDLSARKMPGAGSAPPDPIVDFGPCSYFTVRRIGASDGKSHFVSSGGFASPSVSPPPGTGKNADINPTNFLDFLFGATPRKASSGKGGYESPPGSGNGKALLIGPDREAHTTMAELGVTHGTEFVLIGGVRRKSEAPKCVVGQRNASAQLDPSVPHHFSCAECKETALCRGCAMTCHFGHTITIASPADQPKAGQLQCGCGVVSTPAPAPVSPAAAAAGAGAAAAPASAAGGVLAASACRIRERASALPPSQQPYTEELQLLRAMGYSDDMVQHMTMLVPATALSPNPSPTPAASASASASAAPSPSPTPSPPPQQLPAPAAAVVVVVPADAKADAKAAPAPAAAAGVGGSPVKPPPPAGAPPSNAAGPVAGAAAGAGAAPAAGAAGGSASAQVMVTVGVTLRGLLQSKAGNVQGVVDTLLAWERQGKLTPAANAAPPATAARPAASRPSPVAPVRRS